MAVGAGPGASGVGATNVEVGWGPAVGVTPHPITTPNISIMQVRDITDAAFQLI